MKNWGIEHLHIVSVDNVLVKMADPAFIGYCAAKKVEAGMKAVEKLDPQESVGVLGLKAGKYSVLEYSEIGKELASKRDDSGRLAFRYGNIANHYFSFAFVEKVKEILRESGTLPYHVAKKKIPYFDPKTALLEQPTEPNGIKLELFIFDVLRFVESSLAIFEVPRDREFAPLKNALGTDSAETCRNALIESGAVY
jgi:UDP-N-acetylglucosamine/UDP-N-acetylgalactosamine diphosphorylase